MHFYRVEHSDPKYDAQRNLSGRTHYVDDDTLRYHKSRIISSQVAADGLLYAIVESYAVDPNQRAFRPVIFDVFGTVITRCKLEDGFKTSKAAIRSMRAELSTLDAHVITSNAIDNEEKYAMREYADMRAKLANIMQRKAA